MERENREKPCKLDELLMSLRSLVLILFKPQSFFSFPLLSFPLFYMVFTSIEVVEPSVLKVLAVL